MTEPETLREALTEDVADEFDGASMVGEYVIIAEVFDSEGEPYLVSRESEDMTTWRQMGMLEARMEILRDRWRDV